MSKPTIVVQRFWQEFKPGPDGKLVAVDMIAYGPIGSLDKSLTIDRVSRLSRVGHGTNRNNPAVALAQARWDMIRPLYEAWKAGQEAPLSGTPLGAWNAITPEQAEVFKMRGVKTVEHVAELTDAQINAIPVAHMRQLVLQARAFLESQDKSKFANEMLKKDAQIDEQNETIKALMARMDQMADLLARMTPSQAQPQPQPMVQATTVRTEGEGEGLALAAQLGAAIGSDNAGEAAQAE